MTYNKCNNTEYNIENNIPIPTPADTLLQESISVIKRLPFYKRYILFFFSICMVLFPIIINWINIQMIKGVSNGLAYYFVTIKLIECVIDTFRELFLIKIGIDAEILFVVIETKRYGLLSKPTTYRHPAETVIAKDLTNAASALNRIIEWGMQSVTLTIGQIISSIILLMSMELQLYDGIAFVLFALVLWQILIPIQKIMTERMEIHRKKYDRCNDLMSFRSTEFQNKECQPNEISDTLNDPIAYDRKIRPLYNYTFRTIDVTMIITMIIYAWFSPNDNLFAVKYVLVNSISNAINSIAQFGTQYHRYCNNYEKYYKLFRDPELRYDEYVPPKELPEQFVLDKVNLYRGKYCISAIEPIHIRQGDNFIIQGPSGSGKSSFLDGFLGYIPGISLTNGVNIRSYAHQMVCHLQNAQSISLSSVSIFDVFRSTDQDKICEILQLFFEKDELDSILSNISSENPFEVYIEGKMSGGQKTRFFLAATLFKAIKKDVKIIFLDEPEQGQDYDQQIKSFKEINKFASKRRLTIFWITHLQPELLKETNIQFNKKLKFYKGGRITVAE